MTTIRIIQFNPLQIELPDIPHKQHIEGKVTIELPPTHFVVEELPFMNLFPERDRLYWGTDTPYGVRFDMPPLEDCKKPFTLMTLIEWVVSGKENYAKLHERIQQTVNEYGPLVKEQP